MFSSFKSYQNLSSKSDIIGHDLPFEDHHFVQKTKIKHIYRKLH